MIIPMKPENVRITVQLTSADFEAGAFTHNVDLHKLYDNRNSCAYEFAIDYNGQKISNDYQMFYDDGTLYASVFFPTTDGQMLKLTLTEGEGVISVTEPELPAVTSTDNGKVLTVVEGDWAAANASSNLPAVSVSDNGKVLTVSSGAWTAANPTGVSEGSVMSIVSSSLTSYSNFGIAQDNRFFDISTDDGLTLTVPYVGDPSFICSGHLLLWETESGSSFESDFFYDRSAGFTLSNSTIPSPFTSSLLTVRYVKTGRFFNASNISAFNCDVVFYNNPNGCYFVIGQFTPGE